MAQEDQSAMLSEFLRHIADSLDIPESHYDRAEERYQAISRWLGREESIIASVASEIYPQGSFRLGTVVKPITDAEEYDIDLVCELRLTKDQISQKQLKDRVGYEIKSYARTNSMKSPAEESRRCWRLNYADEAQFHMDILPAIPDGDSFMRLLESKELSNYWADRAIAITDNTLPNYDHLDNDWPRSNPRGYSAWFKTRMEKQFSAQRAYLAESTKAKVEDVPEHRVRTPLQRAVQILKRHRDIMFVDDQEDKPISIIITTLAAHAYNNESDLLEALVNIVDNMPHYIQRREAVAWVANPVDPLENFADKWEEHPKRKENFERWLQQVRSDLGEALRAEGVKAVGEFLESRLGERVIGEALKHFPVESELKVSNFILSSSWGLGRFDVPHRQQPQWPIIQGGRVTISAQAWKKDFDLQQIHSDSAPLEKEWLLRFEAKTSVSHPFQVRWQVVNTGQEAEADDGLRGGFYESNDERYLFSVDLCFINELDGSKVSKKLCEEFREHGEGITPQALVEVKQAGSNWTIVDDGKEYCIRNEDQTLNVYGERNSCVRWEGTTYRGMHWIECFIIKDGICVARSGEFVVNIK